MEATRLLGFAFAGADFLFEVDRSGVILFATGAESAVFHQGVTVGQPGAGLFKDAEGKKFAALARDIAPGGRVGPLPMTLASGESVSLAMCFLPQNERISCTLLRPGQRAAAGKAVGMDRATGLPSRDSFLDAVTENAGGIGCLTLVNLPNLTDVCAKLSATESAGLMASIGASIQTMGVTVAGRISDTGFGVVAPDSIIAASVASRIQDAVREHNIDGIEFEQVLVSLKGRGLTPEQDILALRHVVGRFTDGTLKKVPNNDLAAVFQQMLTETVERAQRFNATVSDGEFRLAFEPIVDLRTGVPTHYEALTRFQPGQSPADMIKFAEELDLATTFDLAVALKIFNMLEREPAITSSVAVNLSGRTISTPISFAMLAGLLAKKRSLAKQVLIEITESAEIADLAAANKAIQALRAMGYRVGIDDFGSGAASLTYLHAFAVDFVKIDGALVQRLGVSPREDALLKSLATTCAELHIETIAEWIDSDDRLKRCRDIGFCFGQGRQFGGTLNELPRNVAQRASVARRRGVQESWG